MSWHWESVVKNLVCRFRLCFVMLLAWKYECATEHYQYLASIIIIGVEMWLPWAGPLLKLEACTVQSKFCTIFVKKRVFKLISWMGNHRQVNCAIVQWCCRYNLLDIYNYRCNWTSFRIQLQVTDPRAHSKTRTVERCMFTQNASLWRAWNRKDHHHASAYEQSSLHWSM